MNTFAPTNPVSALQKRLLCFLLCLTIFCLLIFAPQRVESAVQHAPEDAWQIAQLVEDDPFRRFYPGALTSLIETINQETTLRFDPDPVYIDNFEDPNLFRYPIIYVNYADRSDWTLTEAEQENLRRYIERGGFIYIDAGINAEFLRGDASHGQSHSFADWSVTPVLEEAFATVYPEQSFEPLPRSHPIFRSFYAGLPDASSLPEAIRDYVTNEKWPQGTYSFLGLQVDGRVAVLATPIIAMGWGRNEVGQWTNPIGFRVREDAEGMSSRLSEAAFSGPVYNVTREDGLQDRIFCQPDTMPAWVEEPGGNFRIFRYYNSSEISDYAHQFYTRLGVNIFVHAVSL